MGKGKQRYKRAIVVMAVIVVKIAWASNRQGYLLFALETIYVFRALILFINAWINLFMYVYYNLCVSIEYAQWGHRVWNHEWKCLYVTLDHKTSLKSLGYICSNSQKYIVWVKMIDFWFMPKMIRILSKDYVPFGYFVNFLP